MEQIQDNKKCIEKNDIRKQNNETRSTPPHTKSTLFNPKSAIRLSVAKPKPKWSQQPISREEKPLRGHETIKWKQPHCLKRVKTQATRF